MKSINDNDIIISNKEEFIYYLKILNQIGFYDGKKYAYVYILHTYFILPVPCLAIK